MDSNRIKAIIDLHDYLDTLGNGRPPLGCFLKSLGIDPKVMSDTVVSTAHAIHATVPDYAVEIANQLLKLGVTIGYKYTVSKHMEQSFGTGDDNEQESN
jgi:hypothetical protein